VPKLKGKRLKASKRQARRSNCRIGKVKKRGDATAKTGRVVKQRPKPGKVLLPGARIKVTLGG
jgi:beta-lactam-binding protein with PASTA domain